MLAAIAVATAALPIQVSTAGNATPKPGATLYAEVPPDDPDAAGERYSTGLAASTVGTLISEDMSCSATVVDSPSGQVAVTAAHCVYFSPDPEGPA